MGSSAISETKSLKASISIRDSGVCVLCGDDPVDVAHIVAQKADDIGQHVPISGFSKDDPLNLLSLCCNHHLQYNRGYFVFVPSKSQREVLLNHEHKDFAHRESLIANGQPDPGRTLPNISDEIEYIPIHARRFRAYFHNPTRYDPIMFVFDTLDHHPCQLLHFRASPICLIVQAQPLLANFMRLVSDKADIAQSEITKLLKLYQRRLGGGSYNVPASISSMIRQPNAHPTTYILPTIPISSPPSHPSVSDPLIQLHPEVPTSSSSATVDTESEDPEVGPAQIDTQLLEYAKERAVTWEDLKSRPPLFPGEEGGYYQFSSAEQIIRGEWP